MSYLHLIGKLNEARSNKALALASSKYVLLDNPNAAVQRDLSKEQDEIRDLVTLIDKAEHNQGSLTDIIGQGLKDKLPVFRKLKGVAVAAAAVELEEVKQTAPEAPVPPKKGLKLKVKSKFVREQWVFPNYPYHKYFLPSFESMCGLLTREKRERDLHGMPEWNRNRVDGRLAVVTRTYPKDYMNADAITDLVVEPIRVRCRETKEGAVQKTQEETWMDIIKREKSFENAEEAHERVYSETRGCNLFNITMGVYLLTGDKGNPVWGPVDGPGDVLDPASGWGDRLGAAFIAGARSYRGWDTNPSLQETYAGLAKKYTENGLSLDWHVENAPFETAKLGDQKFDTVLTSPPFYNKELYEGKETSTSVYRNKKEWIDKYYHPMWRNAARALRAGGRVIAYISPGWMFEETDKVMKQMGLSYVGAVGFLQDTIGQPAGYIRDAYIWRLQQGPSIPAAVVAAAEVPVAAAEVPVAAFEPKKITELRERVSRLKAACAGKSLIEGGYNLPQLAVLGTKFKAPRATVKTRSQYEEYLKQHIPTLEAELEAALSKFVSSEPLAEGMGADVDAEGMGADVDAEVAVEESRTVLDFKNPPPGKFVSTDKGVVYDYDGKQQTILEHVNMSHESALERIVTDPSVMTHIGNGTTWTPAKLKEFLRTGENDWNAKSRGLKDPLNKLDNTDRNGFDWVIMNPEPVGVITVFTRDKKMPLGFELRIFMAANQQGKGLGTFALRAALHHLQNHVYSADPKRTDVQYKKYLEASVHKGNTPSMKMLEKAGFRYHKDSYIGRTEVSVYDYKLNNPDDSAPQSVTAAVPTKFDFSKVPEGKFVFKGTEVTYEYNNGADKLSILARVKPEHEKFLYPIVTDPKVMSTVGSGRVWDRERLKRFLKDGENEWNSKPPRQRILKDSRLEHMRAGFDWVILNPEPVGVVSIYTEDEKAPFVYSLRIFISPSHQGKKVGKFAACAAVQYFNTMVYTNDSDRIEHPLYNEDLFAVVNDDNFAAENLLASVGFRNIGRASSLKNLRVGAKADSHIFTYTLRNPYDKIDSYWTSDVLTLSQLRPSMVRSYVQDQPRKTATEFDARLMYEQIMNKIDNRLHTVQDVSSALHNLDRVYNLVYEDSPKSTAGVYDIVARIRGRLLADAITNKAYLHEILTHYGYDFISDTYIFGITSKPDFSKFDGIWIWRPSSGWSGHGVHVVTDKSQFQPLWDEFKKSAKGKDEVLLSRYIDKPMLITGHKFHIRMHLLIKRQNPSYSAVLINTGEIIRAKLPYRSGDYQNADIHDTHMRYNTPLRFPEDFPETVVSSNKVLADMQDILTKTVCIAAYSPELKKLGIPWIEVYAEKDGSIPIGFEIFGCDFMIDEAGKVFLIEINKKPLFAHPHGTQERMDALSNAIFTTMGELLYPVQMPCFGFKKYTYGSRLDLTCNITEPKPQMLKPKLKPKSVEEPKSKELPFKLVPKAAAAAAQIPKWNTVPAWRAFDISALRKPTRPSSCKKTYIISKKTGYASYLAKYLAIDPCEWESVDAQEAIKKKLKVDLMIGSDAGIAADIRAELLADALLDPTAIFEIIDSTTDKAYAQFNPVPSAVFEGRTDEPDYTRYKDENWVIRSSSEGRHPNISGKGPSELKEKWKGVGRIPVLLSRLPLFNGHTLIVSLPFILKLQNEKLHARLLSSGVINTQGKSLRFPEDMSAIEDSENLFKDVKQHASANEKGFSRTAHSIFDYMRSITRDVVSLSWDPMAVAMVGENPLSADTELSAPTAFDVFVIDFMISPIPKKLTPGYGYNDKVYFYGVRQNEQWSDDINDLIARHVYDFVLGGNILNDDEVTNIDYISKDCKAFFEE